MKKLLLTLLGITYSISISYAAIAYDNSTDLGFSFTTSLTTSYTVTGTNMFLCVGGWGGTTSGTDNWTGVTYNSVSLTKVTSFFGVTGRWLELYCMTNPATGAHNVVISASNTEGIDATAFSYSGVGQTGNPTTSGTFNANSTTITVNLTTTVDNSWLTSICHYGGSTAAAGANTFKRNTGANGLYVFDSNGAKSPTGAYSLNMTATPANNVACIGVAFAPPVANIVPLGWNWDF